MFEFLRTKNFHVFFSFLLGIFVILLVRPICKDEACIEHINPEIKEIESSTYQIGSKCYQFKTSSVE